ncbi:hypothetical protein QQG74_09105 [Micromonospora sp. FIMYZ51]|uniref:hypothetical protein n=1 Tax=Micromonospora sp. FIMYZ51 TaxID=3051832 RepID=UPI00311DF12F
MTPSTSATRKRHDTSLDQRHDTSAADTVSDVTSKSGRGTARQTIRMDEELWEKLDAAAKAVGTDRSSYLRDFARWAVHEKGAKMPRRAPLPHVDKTDDGLTG